MGFFSKLRGGNDSAPPADQAQVAANVLVKVKQLLDTDPPAAEKLLRTQAEKFRAQFGIGTALHESFRDLVFTIWRARDPVAPAFILPSYRLNSWKGLETFDQVIMAAREMNEEVLYIAPDFPGQDATPLEQLEALADFSRDLHMVMVFLGEEILLMRRSFILEAAGAVGPEVEEWPMEMAELAKKRGLVVKGMMVL